MKASLSLRHFLPLVLALLVVALIGIDFASDSIQSGRAVEQLTVRRAAALGDLMSRNLERHLAQSDLPAAGEEISALIGVPSLELALVCDDTDRILFSTRIELRQNPLADSGLEGASQLVSRARSTLTAQFEVTADRKQVRAAFPFKLGMLPGQLSSERIGVFYTLTDLVFLKAADRGALTTRSLILSGVGAFAVLIVSIYLRSTLTRRVESLVAATNELAAGNLTVQTQLQGNDELARLGTAFNRMAAELRDRTAALEASEERFQAFLRQSPLVAWVKDDAFRFRYVNRAFERTVGRPASEILGLTDFDVVPAAAAGVRANDLQALAAGKPVETVEVVAGADGRPHHWLVQKFPLEQAGRAPWVGGTAVDITDRFEAEEVLRKVLAGTVSELGRNFFRSLVEHLAGALHVKVAFLGELAGPARDRIRTLSIWSDGASAEPLEYPLKGTPCEAVLERRQCVHSRSLPAEFPGCVLLQRMNAVSYLGVPVCDRRGNPLGVLVVVHDRDLPDREINRLVLSVFASRAGAELERVRAEETLRASEARLHAIVHHTPNVAVQGYDASGRVQLWNEASERMFGWSAAEAMGRTLDGMIYTAEEAEEFVASLRALSGTGRALGPLEYSFHRRNGEPAQCLSTVFEVSGLGGEPMFVCMDVDVTERNRTEARLRQAREQFRNLFQESPLAGVIFSLETRLFVDTNRRFTEMFGFAPEETVGRSGQELGLWTEAADREKLLTALQERSAVPDFEATLRTKDGRRLETLLSAQIIDFATGPVVMVQAVDLTERKRAEQALRDKDRLLRQVIDLVPHFIFAKDRHSRFLFANRAAADAVGMLPEELVGLSDLDLPRSAAEAAAFIEDDREVLRSGIPKFVAAERLTDAQGRVRINQTVKVPFRVPGTDEPALLGVAVDITERQQAETALRASEEMISTIINAIPVRVFWKDRNLRYLGCNVAFARDAGFATPQEVIGKDDFEMGWRAQAELYRSDDRKIVDGGITRLHIEEPLTLPDGRTITLLTSKTPLRGPEGEITGVLGTFLDITERKEAEAARLTLEAQLRQAQKMEAIGTLAGGIAHDFNNILGVILSNAQLAVLDTPPAHPARESLEEISRAGLRAKELVGQILAFSRQQPTHCRAVEAAKILGDAARFLKATIPSGVEVTAEVAPGCPAILADATQVHQVLVNLATNAWHALEDGPGRIGIRLQGVSLPDAAGAAGPDLPPGRYVSLSVTDSGRGMEPDVLKRIFDPFFTTKAPGQGTGLGLSVVHGIVEQHHGAITVDSRPGEGSAFTVYLPAADEADPAPTAAPAVREAGAGQQILLLDDEAPLLEVSRRLLKRLGYRVEGFASPDTALAHFRQHPEQVDLVITDQNMPGQSGLAIATELLRVRPDLPVVLVSGKVTDALRRQAREAGVREVLAKPVDLPELEAAVRRHAGPARS